MTAHLQDTRHPTALSQREAVRDKPQARSSCRALLLVCLGVLYPVTCAQADDQWLSRTVGGNGAEALGAFQGIATDCAIGQPFGVEMGPDGDLYVTEVGNHRIWKIEFESGKAMVIAGNGRQGYSGDGGPATQASLNEPYEVRFDGAGNLYFVEMQNHLIRRIDALSGVISTVAGTGEAGFSGDTGPATEAQFRQPHSLVVDHQRQRLYVADIGNHRIRVIDLATGMVDTLAGNGDKELPVDGQPARQKPLLGPRALALQGDRLWIALREGHSLWSLDLNSETLHHEAGDGEKGFSPETVSAQDARFNGPKGIALTPQGEIVIVDTENHAIRVYSPTKKTVTTISGTGPAGGGYQECTNDQPQSQMNRPHGVTVDKQGRVFVGDTVNHRVRQLTPPALDAP